MFVCEDDVLPHSKFPRLFPLYWSKTPKKFDIVLVGNQTNTQGAKGRFILSRPSFCTHAYIISKEGAKKLLALYVELPAQENEHIIDIFLKKAMRKKKIIYYCYNGKLFPEEIDNKTVYEGRASGICFQNRKVGSSIHTPDLIFE